MTTQPKFTLDKLEHCITVLEELLISDKGLTATEIVEVGRARDLVANTAGTIRNVIEGRQNVLEDRRRVRARDERRREAKRERRRAQKTARRQSR